MDNKELEKWNRLIEQRQNELSDARRAFDRHTGLARAEAVQHAIDLLAVAKGGLRRAYEDLDKQAAEIQALHDWRVARAPPDFQSLVEAFTVRDDSGKVVEAGYPRITPEAWDRWERDVAEWKAKMRNGEFPPLTQ